MGYFSNGKVCNEMIGDNVNVDNTNNDDMDIRDVWSVNNIMQWRNEQNKNQVSFQINL